MKGFLINLAILILLTIFNDAATAQALLNWTVDEINPGEDVTLIPDGSNFTEGMKSCHLQLNSRGVPYLLSDVFYITPGAAYEFSFDVFDNDTAGQVKVYADFYDTYGFDIFGQPPVFSTDSSAWQSISWTGTIPEQAVVGYVLIKFYNQPDLYNFTKTAHIWMDNVQFREAGGINLLPNGGFEEWVVGIDEKRNEGNKLFIYPNPACSQLAVGGWQPSAVSLQAALSLTITDLYGRNVNRFQDVAYLPFIIDISNLQTGIYIIRMTGDDGQCSSAKFLKVPD